MAGGALPAFFWEVRQTRCWLTAKFRLSSFDSERAGGVMIKTTRSHPLIELLGQFVDTVKAMWRRKASVNEIVRLDQQEAARISRDLGISTHDLYALVGEGKNAADLLVRRITTLGLEPKKLDHAIMHDLQRCCS